MKLRIWNDKYYVHACPNEGYADVSVYLLKEGYYCCSSFCSFKFPSMLALTPLPIIKGDVKLYGHKTIACHIKTIEIYEF